MLEGLKVDQTKVYESTDIDITKLAGGVSCLYRCIIISCRSYVVLKFDKEEWSADGVCFYTFE